MWLRLTVCLVLAVGCGTPFGIYHKVERGHTLFRIAQTYNVPVDKIQRINRINDPRKIQPGDLIFVPGADRRRAVPVSGGASPRSTPKAVSSGSSQGSSRSGDKVRIASKPPTGSKTTPKSTWGGGDAPRLIWPVKGTVTSGFGKRGGIPHDGLDIGASTGTPIHASADGRVIYSGNGLSGYGNLVIVRHQGSWATVYAHNDQNLVDKDDFVSQGQKIATVGETGRASGPHLHFEVRFGKSAKNPLQYLPER